MARKPAFGLIFSVVLAATAAFVWALSPNGRLQASVRFVGYTNTVYGAHVAVVQVSNSSTFSIVRCRSPQVIFDSATASVSYAPTGRSLLRPGDCEEVWTEPLTNGLRWRFRAVCKPLGRDGMTAEKGVQALQRKVSEWLEDHRAPIRIARPRDFPGTEFSTDWIDP